MRTNKAKLQQRKLLNKFQKYIKLHDGFDIEQLLKEEGIPELKFSHSPERINKEKSIEIKDEDKIKEKAKMNVNRQLKKAIGNKILKIYFYFFKQELTKNIKK